MILFSSGCGKTTFLQALSGRIKASSKLTLYSDVLACNDGYERPLSRHEIAFVDQIDSHFSMLTVRETLLLAAALRNPDMDMTERDALVDSNMRSLNLLHIMDSRVGDESTRGISGGEKKRLSVGCELVGDTTLLLADEPTSGLDSFQAQQVIQLFKKLSQDKNIITVCTIHQPGSFIYSLFDDILLLTSEGKVAYFGPRNEAPHYFQNIGYKCPELTNPAEFFIDLISLNSSSPEALRASKERARTIAAHYHDSVKNRKVTPALFKASDWTDSEYTQQKSNNNIALLPLRAAKGSLRFVGGTIRRFSLLLNRAAKQTLRDMPGNLARLGVSSVLGLCIAMVYGSSKGDLGGIKMADAVGAIANTVINIAMMSTIKALQTFKKERLVIERERVNKHYTAVEYLVAKSVADLPIEAIIASVIGSHLPYD